MKPNKIITILDTVSQYIRQYVVIEPEQIDACSLWIAHTHAFDAAETTPYLEISSPEKQSGKTRLLEVLDLIAARSWFTGRVTPAVLYRKIDKEKPTLLLDESDTAFKGNPEYSETLRGILNSGYRKNGKVTVCVGQGKNITYQDFSSFCPKAIAGLNNLPDTLRDRSITITMRRRAPGEKVDRFRYAEAEKIATPIRESLKKYVDIESLKKARPAIPEKLNDRAADCWEPLLAIADLAGSDWPNRARQSALALSGNGTKEDDSLGIKLLRDIRQIFKEKEKLFSDDICTLLRGIEESPWGELPFGTYRGKPIDPRRLAYFLKQYGIGPKQIKKEGIGKKGYERTDFQDVWTRYLPPISIERNKGNHRNHNTSLEEDNEKVSIVSDVSAAQGTNENTLFPDFPYYGNEHTHELTMITNNVGTYLRCKHCGEFAPK